MVIVTSANGHSSKSMTRRDLNSRVVSSDLLTRAFGLRAGQVEFGGEAWSGVPSGDRSNAGLATNLVLVSTGVLSTTGVLVLTGVLLTTGSPRRPPFTMKLRACMMLSQTRVLNLRDNLMKGVIIFEI